MNRQQHQLMLVMRKIGVFKGLTLEHIQRILRVATSKQFAVGQRICVVAVSYTHLTLPQIYSV